MVSSFIFTPIDSYDKLPVVVKLNRKPYLWWQITVLSHIFGSICKCQMSENILWVGYCTCWWTDFCSYEQSFKVIRWDEVNVGLVFSSSSGNCQISISLVVILSQEHRPKSEYQRTQYISSRITSALSNLIEILKWRVREYMTYHVIPMWEPVQQWH